jgi:hypothetical protein
MAYSDADWANCVDERKSTSGGAFFLGDSLVAWLRKKKISIYLSMIQVDIGGHPPFSTGSKQFSGNFGNLLFLAGFNFRGHFEGLNEVFLRSRFSMISKGMIEPPK